MGSNLGALAMASVAKTTIQLELFSKAVEWLDSRALDLPEFGQKAI